MTLSSDESNRPNALHGSDGSFRRVGSDVDFVAMEEGVLALWDRIDAFQASIDLRPAESEYTFYDGPPFASGSPHYGHILAGVIKDIVPRYWTMRGRRVERRFGWDTHGLPVELEVEKQLGVHGPREIEEFGVARFNEACRAMVENTAEEWAVITRRIGRWVDMDNDYRTMDIEFMESVWWIISELWRAGLIYRDFKVVPYSWGATTVLSNFEANEEYRDVDDPAVTIRVRVTQPVGPLVEGDWLLLWTTTPWTLPGNLAVAVGADIAYSRISDEGDHYWLAEDMVEKYWPDGAKVETTAAGSALVGARYEPMFDFFADEDAFRIIAADHVNTEDGTGLVHEAPAYGEEDFVSLKAAGIDALVDPIDAEGNFTDAVPLVAGMNIKGADAVLIADLKERGALVRHDTIRHPYPFCPRTYTPIMYKAVPTWFVRVEALRERMAELNEAIHWVPEFVGRRRFHNWVTNARDWAVSRNRYWGTTIPVWVCDSCDEQVCVGSVDALEELSGVRLTDLHKQFADAVSWPCASCQGAMKRTPEVLDTWFDSGSMPFSEIHYPFENEARFERRFPADFIAEGLDQTRGWFYTLLILATALKDKRPFDNVVVNGLILAEDGVKMSKRRKNYPDPAEILDEFGADALRAYLINSPVLRAEPLRFSAVGVRQVVRTILLPLWNAFSFFTTYAEADAISLTDLADAPPPADRPEMDRWILSVSQSLVESVNRQMEGYYLYDVIPPMIDFIEDLTNWYIRRSRRRFWRARESNDNDKLSAFATLYEVLVTTSKVLAPVVPFITEELYQRLIADHSSGEPDSVHHCDYPTADPGLIDRELEASMSHVRVAVRLGHGLRKQGAVRVRQPLKSVTILTHDEAVLGAIRSHTDLIADELNVRDLEISSDEAALVELRVKPDFSVLGPRLGAEVQAVAGGLADLDGKTINSVLDGSTIEVAGHVLTLADLIVERAPRDDVAVASEGLLSVALNMHLTDELIAEGLAREVVNRIQAMRREHGLAVTDRISVTWSTESSSLAAAIETHTAEISAEVLATSMTRTSEATGARVDITDHVLMVSITE